MFIGLFSVDVRPVVAGWIWDWQAASDGPYHSGGRKEYSEHAK